MSNIPATPETPAPKIIMGAPAILKRRYIEGETPFPKVGLKGEYRLVKTTESGIVLQDTGWFDNMILDSGLNRWGTGSVINGAAIGTGNLAPAVTQTSLQAQAAYTTNQITSTDTAQASPPYYVTSTVSYRFAAGTLNGNYYEVGVGWASGNMFSRALIVDSLGAPTSIAVALTEALDVYYRLRQYPPAADVVASFTIGGVSTTVTSRAASITNANYWKAPSGQTQGQNYGTYPTVYNGAIGAITGTPSGSSAIAPSPSSNPNVYSNNSLQITYYTTWPLLNGNLAGGISAYTLNVYGCYQQYGFSPAITKDGTKTLVLTTGHSWGRH